MHAPKILPWIAKKAGISDELALRLWRRAVNENSAQNTAPDFHGRCVERFLDLVEASAGGVVRVNYTNNPAPVSWIWRHQGRMALYGLIAAQNAATFWQNTWSNASNSWQAAWSHPQLPGMKKANGC